MAGYLFTNSTLMLEQAMRFQWTKQTVINDNIANAETPNYKVKYVTFEEALDDSIRTALRGTDRRAKSVRATILRARPRIHVAENESMRMDDNGVNVTEQETEATRNALQMQYTMDVINRELTGLRSLIKGQ